MQELRDLGRQFRLDQLSSGRIGGRRCSTRHWFRARSPASTPAVGLLRAAPLGAGGGCSRCWPTASSRSGRSRRGGCRTRPCGGMSNKFAEAVAALGGRASRAGRLRRSSRPWRTCWRCTASRTTCGGGRSSAGRGEQAAGRRDPRAAAGPAGRAGSAPLRVRPQRHGEPVHGVRNRWLGAAVTESCRRADWAWFGKGLLDGRYRARGAARARHHQLNIHAVASQGLKSRL